MALGCDQGGSVRLPACWCGIVGMKPTYGLVPYTGILGLDNNLDHCGPMARTVHDCALLLEVVDNILRNMNSLLDAAKVLSCRNLVIITQRKTCH